MIQSPYLAYIKDGKRRLDYRGNRCFLPIENITGRQFDAACLKNVVTRFSDDPGYIHLHAIDNAIFFGAVNYFHSIGAQWCNLPLTTLMISSPGEVYAGQKLDYTTDTLPIELQWFENQQRVFLAESSQFYLELRLLAEGVDKVFSIYNSFRKEPADFCRLSEFQHIEFEGHVGFEENVKVARGLMGSIARAVVKEAAENLNYYLDAGEIDQLESSFEPEAYIQIPFKDALSILKKETADSRYDKFSMQHFGAWEEIFLTQTLGKHVIVTEFPLLQIPFYHNERRVSPEGVPLAENADIILHGYRETIGSGVRISSPAALAEKARVFSLPLDDYAPYLNSRQARTYRPSAGFGMGWQRYTHWLLKLPFIWETCHVPRGHLLPVP